VAIPSLSGLFSRVFIAGLVSALLVPALAGQSKPELARAEQHPNTSSNTTVTESASVLKITTRLVIVDVVATDRKGLPVTDLKQDEFRLTEDGQEEHVRVFSFQDMHANSTGEPAQVAAVDPPLPPNVVTNLRRFARTGPLNVLLLDGLNTRMNNQQYVKTELVEFLKKLPADQPLAVYLLGTRLQLLQDFTSDPAVLKDVLLHLKEFRSPLMDNAAGGPEKFWMEGMLLVPEVKRRVLEFQQETESDQVDQRVAITISALNSLARTLAGYPGRKNLIWVSENIPITIVPNKIPHGKSAERARRSYDQVVASTANLLTDAQIAVYPVDARALVNSDLFNPAAEYDARGDRNGSSGAQMGQAMDDTANELMAARGAMQEIAEETGGRAFYNRNDIGNAVRLSIEDGSTYYTLGYYPENKSWDGRFRKTSVKVSRPGVTLRYRLGYFAMDPERYAKENAQRRDAEFSALLSPEVPIATGLHFMAGILQPSLKSDNKTVINFAIDAKALSFSADDAGKKRASVQCVVRVFSKKGPSQPLKTEAYDIDADLPPESYSKIMKTGLPCRTTLDLPAGEYVLRLGVRDNHTGLMGTANAQLVIPNASESSSKAVDSKP